MANFLIIFITIYSAISVIVFAGVLILGIMDMMTKERAIGIFADCFAMWMIGLIIISLVCFIFRAW